jgi:putative transposase
MPLERRSYRSARKRRRKRVTTTGQAKKQASMTLADFDEHFRTWVLETYHHRRRRRLSGTPLTRWREGTWLPRLPKSQNELDLLLLCEGKTRQVQQEGIRFQGHRYMDGKLAGYVLSTVRISYDPLDLRTITVYASDEGGTGGRFLCQARCQDFEEHKVSLKDIVAARKSVQRELQTQLKKRKDAVAQVRVPKPGTASVSAEPSDGSATPVPTFKPPRFMAQLAPEFVREE